MFILEKILVFILKQIAFILSQIYYIFLYWYNGIYIGQHTRTVIYSYLKKNGVHISTDQCSYLHTHVYLCTNLFLYLQAGVYINRHMLIFALPDVYTYINTYLYVYRMYTDVYPLIERMLHLWHFFFFLLFSSQRNSTGNRNLPLSIKNNI